MNNTTTQVGRPLTIAAAELSRHYDTTRRARVRRSQGRFNSQTPIQVNASNIPRRTGTEQMNTIRQYTEAQANVLTEIGASGTPATWRIEVNSHRTPARKMPA
jgi:hypothetical protein